MDQIWTDTVYRIQPDCCSVFDLLPPRKLLIFLFNEIHVITQRITDVCTTALLLTKPSSDDDSGFRHGFGAKALLPLAQSAPAVTHDTTRLCWIVITLWDCYIHADAVRALSWIFLYFLMSDRKSQISQEYRGWTK